MKRKSPAVLALLCLASYGLNTVAQQPETKATEAREITGRVVSDSGQPLAGATIAAGRSGGPSSQRTSTDSEGNFRVQGLDPGFYRLFASLPGYVIQAPQDPGNPNSFYRPGDSVSLTLIKGGVISGTVNSIGGEPMVGVMVRALRVRDAEGEKIQSVGFSQTRMTDDRGYYRLYGLAAGTYIVLAGGQGQIYVSFNPYAADAPTYAPSSTRDTAAEFIVRPEQEVTADIRYRGEAGHAVSGKVSGPAVAVGPNMGSVRLIDAETRATVAAAPAVGDDRTFQINGVSDGEYEISAMSMAGGPGSEINASPSRRISVKGSDVTGLELTVAPMASISGRVNLELDDKLNCGRRRDNALRETMIIVRRERPEEKTAATKATDTTADSMGIFQSSVDNIPNDKGEILLRNLGPATYRFEIRLPGAGWYLRELALPPDPRAANKTAPNIAKNGLSIKNGDKISGLTITIVEGGAGFRGRVSPSEGQVLPAALRVYLVPAERDASENMYRFFEGTAEADGKFAIGNIAPGRYWLIAQPQDLRLKPARSIRTDSALRARILRDAEALKREVVFKPCDRTVDYELPLSFAQRTVN